MLLVLLPGSRRAAEHARLHAGPVFGSSGLSASPVLPPLACLRIVLVRHGSLPCFTCRDALLDGLGLHGLGALFQLPLSLALPLSSRRLLL